MAKRNSTVKIVNGKVVFSKEVLSYFDNLRTEENSIWIDKYFEYLSNEENLNIFDNILITFSKKSPYLFAKIANLT